jgi:alkanesulfonate monooxygenase SsuD/methylene tetrahydromethanopterin reductase-like flavin-dependent oxidoreductase (luciferase family)
MKFALHFGNNTFSDPEGARRLVRLAEAAGFDSVFAIEHVVFPDNTPLSIPTRRVVDYRVGHRRSCPIR